MKHCNDCGAIIKGRIDKRFCNDHCRCNHYNTVNKNRDQGLKKINAILKRNQVILAKFNENGITQLSNDMLVSSGFNFGFFTHLLAGPKGEIYHCCYTIGYLKISDTQILIKPLPV